jgi:tetrahydromethanopterin S-methyltransferase subunit F
MKKIFDKMTEEQIGLAIKIVGWVTIGIAIGFIIAGVLVS